MANPGSSEKAATVIDSFLNHNTQQLRGVGELKTVAGKTPYELIPVEAMEEFALAMKEGAEKYAINDWRNGRGMPWTWLIAAILRHSWALMRGEDLDPDSPLGLHHAAKVMASAAMLLYYFKHRDIYNKDDRFYPRAVDEGTTMVLAPEDFNRHVQKDKD